MIPKYLFIHPRIELFATTLTLIFITLLFRFPGFNSTPFWLDELWRVNLFIDPHILDRYIFFKDPQTAITSPIYFLINKLISFINISPSILRLSSLIPSIGVVVLSFFFMRKFDGNLPLCFLVALFFATNSQFIRYSNELKPYMLEVFTHCACMYFWVRSINFHSSNNLEYKLLFTFILFSILTSANIIFFLPSIFIILFLQNKNNKNTLIFILKYGFIPTLFTVIFCYFFIWSTGSNEGMISFWEEGFATINDNYFFWLFNKSREIIQGAFLFSTGTVPNRKYWFFVFLIVLYYFIFKKNFVDFVFLKIIFLFYFIFILVFILLNFLKFWPIGNLRPNLFLYCHIFICFGLLFVALKKIKFFSVLLSLGLIIFIIQLTQTNFSSLGHYSPPHEEHDKVWLSFNSSSPLINIIYKECNLKDESIFFMTPSMRYAFNYHRKKDENDNLMNSILLHDCVKIITLSDEVLYDNNKLSKYIYENTLKKQPFWVLYSFVYKDNVDRLRKLFNILGVVDIESYFVNAGFFHITR